MFVAAGKALQHFLGRDRFAPIAFSDGEEKFSFLFRGELERTLGLARKDRDDSTFLEVYAFDYDSTLDDFTGGDFHGGDP